MWLDQVLQGVLLGGYYALIACGLSFMFGILRIVNLAHGSIAVLSAYLVWVVAEQLKISPFLALIAVLPVMAAAGWLLQRTVLERSLRSGALTPLLSTFGLAVVIDNVLFQRFGADTRSLAPDIGDLLVIAKRLKVISVGDVLMSWMQLDEAVQGGDRVIELVVDVIRIGRHQLSLGGPNRIGVLAFDFVEGFGSLVVRLILQKVHRVVIEFLDGTFLVVILVIRGAST